MKIFIFAVLVAASMASRLYERPVYPRSYPAYKPSYQKSYDDYAPMPYDFAWAVKDDYTYNDYAHQESSDGNGYVSGAYRTYLPDGRTQTVTYKADDYSGYVADVKYDGEAKSNDYYKPSYYKPSYSKYPESKYYY